VPPGADGERLPAQLDVINTAIVEQLQEDARRSYAQIGAFDVLTEVVCEDDNRLLALLEDEIRSIPGVRATETLVYLTLSQQTYQWRTR
jgi:DNA-binding Lrp family transcriptional regulator